MSRATSSKNLPIVLQTIEHQKLEGVLVSNLSPRQSVQLFFRQGILIYVCSDQSGQGVDELLHELLGQARFELQWQPLQVRLSQPNVTAETRTALQDVLPILIDAGNFLSPAASRLEGDFFNQPPTITRAEEMLPISLPSVPVKVVSNPLNFYETNLLLPPGQRQDQLEDLLGQVGFEAQVESLSRAHFTGYAYYNLASKGDWGLVLFLAGSVTDIIYSQGSPAIRQVGEVARRSLEGVGQLPQLYRVEENVLKAYRGLVACDQPRSNISATKANFNALTNAFQQAQRDGVIILYVDRLKLYYFFLFEKGVSVGLFAPESRTGRLAPLAAPLALPGADANASFTILPANRLSKPVLAVPSPTLPAKPVVPARLTPPPVFQFDIPTESVAPHAGAKVVASYSPDMANPFDF